MEVRDIEAPLLEIENASSIVNANNNESARNQGKGRSPSVSRDSLPHSFLSQPDFRNISVQHTQRSRSRSSSLRGDLLPVDEEWETEVQVLPNDKQAKDVERAAAIVEQALRGRWMPLEVVHQPDFQKAKKAFLLYHHFSSLRHFVVVIFMILPYFEIPMWCKGKGQHPCGDPAIIPLGGIPYLPRHVTLLIESCCLAVLAGLVYLQYLFLGREGFIGRKIPLYKALLTLLAVIDTIIGILVLHELFSAVPIRLSSYIRLVIIVVFSRALRGCMGTALHILRSFVDVLLPLALFVFFSSWLAYVIFRHTPQGALEFRDFLTTLMDMFILLTTANNPNVWVPAVTENRLSFIFFFAYLVLGIYFLLNIVLSVIYWNYKAQMNIHEKKGGLARLGSLRGAFSLLDFQKRGFVLSATITSLFAAMDRYKNIPDLRQRTLAIFMALDRRGDFKIWEDEFESLCDVVRKEIERKQGPNTALQRHLSHVISVGAMDGIRAVMFSEAYRIAMSLLLGVSLLLAVVEATVDSEASRPLIIKIEIALGWVLILEMLLKVLFAKWYSYWALSVNRYDIFATILLAVAAVASMLSTPGTPSSFLIRYALIVRGLRLITLLFNVPKLRRMAHTSVNIIPKVLPMAVLQFVVCSAFSIVGMGIFGGQVFRGNPKLEGTDYYLAGLLPFNFNDFAAAMMTCFNLCIVNNWYVIASGLTTSVGQPWTILFFVAFYFIAVTFVLNIVAAFVLEAFMGEMERLEDIAARAAVADNGSPSPLGLRLGPLKEKPLLLKPKSPINMYERSFRRPSLCRRCGIRMKNLVTRQIPPLL